MVFLAVSIILSYLLFLAYNQRQSIKSQGDQYSQEILNSVEEEIYQQGLKEYLSFNPTQNRQKVLKREDNLVIVNFINHNQVLSKSFKLTKGIL